MKAPGIHCYAAGSIPAVTPRYCTKKIEKCSLEQKKTTTTKKFKKYLCHSQHRVSIVVPTAQSQNLRRWHKRTVRSNSKLRKEKKCNYVCN
jgi:hypothetical protein